MKTVIFSALVGVIAGLLVGWNVAGWHADSVSLAVTEAAQAIRDDARQRESTIARDVLEQAAARAPVERVIDRGVIREVQKTEYRNVCFGDDLVRMLNDGAKGKPAGAVPGKPAGGMP